MKKWKRWIHDLFFESRMMALLLWLRNFIFWGFGAFMRISGPVFLLGGILLISFIILVYFIEIHHRLFQEHLWIGRMSLLISCFFGFHILLNYLLCAFTDPGCPPLCDDPGRLLGQRFTIIDGKRVYKINYKLEIAPGVNYRYCRYCSCIKPPRSHHCSVCNRCVFEMDHHCPWMNNCIGYRNYRYFVLFLFYITCGAIYALMINISYILQQGNLLLYRDISFGLLTMEAERVLFLCVVIALSGIIAAGFLLLWHIYLTFTNQTTIEFYMNLHEKQEAESLGQVFRNPFDQGWKKNWYRILGDPNHGPPMCIRLLLPSILWSATIPTRYPQILTVENAPSIWKTSHTYQLEMKRLMTAYHQQQQPQQQQSLESQLEDQYSESSQDHAFDKHRLNSHISLLRGSSGTNSNSHSNSNNSNNLYQQDAENLQGHGKTAKISSGGDRAYSLFDSKKGKGSTATAIQYV